MRETIVQQFKRPNGVRTETLALKPMVACVLGLAYGRLVVVFAS